MINLKQLGKVTLLACLIEIIFWLCVLSCHAWSNEQIASAIFKAEGDLSAQFYYGIRSVKYKDINEARRICLNTIRNQRKRHATHKCGLTFLECLANRYCPTKGKLSKAEKALNGNWLTNVKFYLDKSK